MKILLAYGTRPEWIKIKPLVNEFKKNGIIPITLFTGQHKDLVNETQPHYEAHIFEDGENRLNSIVSSCLYSLSNIIKLWNIDYVLVQGDTSSALGIALSAFHHGIKIIHLEAGLRTYDNKNPYPEEVNRRLISQIADIHFCPTYRNEENLIEERVLGEKYVVGNTVLDNLLKYKDDCEYTNKVLVTMHRRENHRWMGEWFHEINELAAEFKDLEFIFPLHPNPNVLKYEHILTNVTVVKPMSHDELLNLLIKTKYVITDSGGIQEECSFFNKICLVCRKVTERPEALGQSSYTVHFPKELKYRFYGVIDKYGINYNCPFGDGTASKKITEILLNLDNDE